MIEQQQKYQWKKIKHLAIEKTITERTNHEKITIEHYRTDNLSAIGCLSVRSIMFYNKYHI